MVEYTSQLDNIFASLSDPTRRDILSRVAYGEFSVGELASHYNLTFAAISKHLKVMERAQLIIKRKDGKKQMISLSPDALMSADEYLEQYRRMWQGRYDKLETLIQ